MTDVDGLALQLAGVTRRFSGLTAVSEVSLRVAPGARHGIIGPNGAGKTTLFNVISGELPATSGSIIRLLLGQFQKEVQDLPWGNASKLGVTPYQVVTIASMIEREAKLDKERPLIAAVIYNRLKINMPLAIDATIQYIDPDPSNGLTDSDLAIESPYNTRLHPGLPPTPIASPRLKSVEAALNPADVSYLYYVLCPKDGPGKHRFSTSYNDFINNKNECLG